MNTTTRAPLCDECETCAHCMTQGCIPKQTLCDTAFVPLRELPIVFVGDEPDRWSRIGTVALWALLCIAMAASLGFAAGVLL